MQHTTAPYHYRTARTLCAMATNVHNRAAALADAALAASVAADTVQAACADAWRAACAQDAPVAVQHAALRALAVATAAQGDAALAATRARNRVARAKVAHGAANARYNRLSFARLCALLEG